jgi:hypothetical protein
VNFLHKTARNKTEDDVSVWDPQRLGTSSLFRHASEHFSSGYLCCFTSNHAGTTKGNNMATINRRTFLIRGSGVVAVAGAATAIPALLPALTGADAAEPKAGATDTGVGSTTDSATGPLTEPLIAHIRDLSTGEIGLFSGEQEIVIHNRQLARSLFSASH